MTTFPIDLALDYFYLTLAGLYPVSVEVEFVALRLAYRMPICWASRTPICWAYWVYWAYKLSKFCYLVRPCACAKRRQDSTE